MKVENLFFLCGVKTLLQLVLKLSVEKKLNIHECNWLRIQMLGSLFGVLSHHSSERRFLNLYLYHISILLSVVFSFRSVGRSLTLIHSRSTTSLRRYADVQHDCCLYEIILLQTFFYYYRWCLQYIHFFYTATHLLYQ